MLPTAAALGPWDKPRSWCDPGRALGGSTVRPPWAPKRVWGCAGVSRPPGGRRGLRGHGTAPPRGEAGGKSFPVGRGPARASAPQVGCVPVRRGPEPKSPRAAPPPGSRAFPTPRTGGYPAACHRGAAEGRGQARKAPGVQAAAQLDLGKPDAKGTGYLLRQKPREANSWLDFVLFHAMFFLTLVSI